MIRKFNKLYNKEMAQELISHASKEPELQVEITKIRNKILESISNNEDKEKSLQLLQELSEFDLGKFLICNKGLNGKWTSYIVLYPSTQNTAANGLENWLLKACPVLLATQERFRNFQNVLNKHINNGMKIASIPCGLMNDLLRLDFSKITNIELYGVDLDPDSLILAEKLSAEMKLKHHCKFLHCDAWNLPWNNELDILVSNGLNIYVHDNQKLEELYKEFHKSIKPDGILVTSFLTPPQTLDENSPWLISSNDPDLIKQSELFGILNVQWQSFKSENEVRETLSKIGFEVLEIIYDAKRIFPTVVAKKRF